MSQFNRKQPTDYSDGRTKQAFKDDTDINKILKRANKAGTISHLDKFEGTYGDYADFDFFENQLMLTRGREVFDQLPAELRREFQQSPQKFFAYVNDDKNKDKLHELLPQLAEPGDIRLDASMRTPPETASRPQDAEPATTEATPAPPSANPAQPPSDTPNPPSAR